MVKLQEYTSTDGRSPFADWFNELNAPAAAKIAVALILLAGGTKKRQQKDIEVAQVRWEDYEQRKKNRGGK